jgi:hypothetical protein
VERIGAACFLVNRAEKFGLMDAKGAELIPVAYESFRETGTGYLEFTLKDRVVWMDVNSKRIFERQQ